MSSPLPLNLSIPDKIPPRAHAGLWFEKFCNTWNDKKWELGAEEKLTWINTVTAVPAGDSERIKEYVARLISLVQKREGKFRCFRTISRFVTGLGLGHPIENGFLWHSSLGVPCLPGSSVKGVVRAWAKTWTNSSNEDISRIFGPDSKRMETTSISKYHPVDEISPIAGPNTGSVIFFDAIPTKSFRLAADVMTPHYGLYYESGEIPGDWHNPVPIPFLTVPPGETFLFALAPRTPASRSDCAAATEWLAEALRSLGAGAKTAVGYGRFEHHPEAQRKAEEDARLAAETEGLERARAEFVKSLANLSPLARELAETAFNEKWERNPDAFKKPDAIQKWIERLENGPQPDAVQQLCRFFDLHFPGLLLNPDKTSGKKNKPIAKPAWITMAKRLIALRSSTKRR